MAQYSPEASGRMEDIYGESARLLSQIESLKRRKTMITGSRTMSVWLFALLFALAPKVASAASVEEQWGRANGAYADGDYAGALAIYDSIEQEGMMSPDLFYNMGNAYFKNGDIGWAMLYYKKAERLSPSDEDIEYNIGITQNFVKDRIEEVPKFFVLRWWSAAGRLMSSDGWAVLSLVMLGVALIGLLLYLLPLRLLYRKLGFAVMLVFALVTLLSMLFATQQKRLITDSDEAVVVISAVPVKSSPNSTSKDIFIIHEGTMVRVVETLDEWSEVVIADGNKGWVLTSSIERVY
jgi:tetratricopeptide (TPR) repeat protein